MRKTIFVLVVILSGCSRAALVDAAMMSAYRPPRLNQASPYLLLAGDMHCHVMPPDSPSHVERGLAETLALARQEGLDFVVLTPHVRARFFMDEAARERFLRSQALMREAISRSDTGDVVVIPGFEYTDSAFGHAGVAFADPARVLAAVPVAAALDDPPRFFEEWVREGGILVINHPLLLPLRSSFSAARGNLSWRPFTSSERSPSEILRVTELAQGIEVYNLGVTHVRDGLFLGDRDRTLRRATFLADRQARVGARRIAVVGGSDSHGHHLRATTFVLAETRSQAGIAGAVRAGRTCVRSPQACSLEARPMDGAGDARTWSTIGSSLHGTAIEVRASGDPIDIFQNGTLVAHPADHQAVRLRVDPAECTTVRARVGEGFSSPTYVNCAFAD